MSELKTIDIKGKQYVQVHERVRHFNETYPDGKIVTELISDTKDPLVFIKATVTPDIGKSERFFTGYSQAKWGDSYINKSSALENAETSAVGRALGFMGIGIVDALCTSDEIDKAKSQTVTEDDFLVMTPKDAIKKIRQSGVPEEWILKKYGSSYMKKLEDFPSSELEEMADNDAISAIKKRYKSEVK